MHASPNGHLQSVRDTCPLFRQLLNSGKYIWVLHCVLSKILLWEEISGSSNTVQPPEEPVSTVLWFCVSHGLVMFFSLLFLRPLLVKCWNDAILLKGLLCEKDIEQIVPRPRLLVTEILYACKIGSSAAQQGSCQWRPHGRRTDFWVSPLLLDSLNRREEWD